MGLFGSVLLRIPQRVLRANENTKQQQAHWYSQVDGPQNLHDTSIAVCGTA
jgi:hypothetical protein